MSDWVRDPGWVAPVTYRNDVTLSDDRMSMVIRSNGRKAELRSGRLGGFTEVDVSYARHRFEFAESLRAGQMNVTRRKGPFFIHINTGPPLWLLPRVQVKRNQVMVGWLRGLVAVKYSKRQR